MTENSKIIRIRPKFKLRLLGLKELREYKDLLYFLVWRDIKVLYAQTVLGFLWAILVPAIQIIIFTVIFGKVAKISTDGIPYILYSTIAIIPWNYISESMSQASLSLVSGQALLGKIYFPRILFPITPLFSKLIDFSISLVLIFAVMIYYHVKPGWNVFLIPLFLLQMVLTSAAIGVFFSALAIRFRDVKFAMQFILKMLIYTAPIVYSVSAVPSKYRLIYSLNPIVGVIEGFRFCLIGSPISVPCIVASFAMAVSLFVCAALYFHSAEHIFVDVI